jgi:hypothetical protein
MQMIAVVHPFSRIFSPAVGGSQNVARVSSTITVEQSENQQSAKQYNKANKGHFYGNLATEFLLRITWL